jgi:arylsulfatase A-like enzyme
MVNINRRRFTSAAAATALLTSFSRAVPQAKQKRPNVVFLMADEWRAQAFGFAGDTNAYTPTFDQLAKESVNFSETASGCPVCCPVRASLMTGQYPLTHGVLCRTFH